MMEIELLEKICVIAMALSRVYIFNNWKLKKKP